MVNLSHHLNQFRIKLQNCNNLNNLTIILKESRVHITQTKEETQPQNNKIHAQTLSERSGCRYKRQRV